MGSRWMVGRVTRTIRSRERARTPSTRRSEVGGTIVSHKLILRLNITNAATTSHLSPQYTTLRAISLPTPNTLQHRTPFTLSLHRQTRLAALILLVRVASDRSHIRRRRRPRCNKVRPLLVVITPTLLINLLKKALLRHRRQTRRQMILVRRRAGGTSCCRGCGGRLINELPLRLLELLSGSYLLSAL